MEPARVLFRRLVTRVSKNAHPKEKGLSKPHPDNNSPYSVGIDDDRPHTVAITFDRNADACSVVKSFSELSVILIDGKGEKDNNDNGNFESGRRQSHATSPGPGTNLAGGTEGQYVDGSSQTPWRESGWQHNAGIRNSQKENIFKVTPDPSEGESAHSNMIHPETPRRESGWQQNSWIRNSQNERILKLTVEPSEGESAHLNMIHREVVDMNRDLLNENMDPLPVCRELQAAGIFTPFHGQQLRRTVATDDIVAGNMLLLKFICRMGTLGFIELVSALNRTGQRKLASMLMKTEKKVRDFTFPDRGSQNNQVELKIHVGSPPPTPLPEEEEEDSPATSPAPHSPAEPSPEWLPQSLGHIPSSTQVNMVDLERRVFLLEKALQGFTKKEGGAADSSRRSSFPARLY